MDDEGHKQVVSYMSQSLSPAKHHYSTTHQEYLAVVHFVKEF
jgi:hypothetical protein